MQDAGPNKHQTLLSDDRPGSVPTLELISRAASSVGVMYRSHGPNTGSNPGGGQIPKKICPHRGLSRGPSDPVADAVLMMEKEGERIWAKFV